MSKEIHNGLVLVPGNALGFAHLMLEDYATTTSDSLYVITEPEPDLMAHVAQELRSTIEYLQIQGCFTEAELLDAHLTLLTELDSLERGWEQASPLQEDFRDDLSRSLLALLQGLEKAEHRQGFDWPESLAEVEQRLRLRLCKDENPWLPGIHGGMDARIVLTPELRTPLVEEGLAKGIKGYVVDEDSHDTFAAELARRHHVPVIRVECLDDLGVDARDLLLIDGENGCLLINPGDSDIAKNKSTRTEQCVGTHTGA